MSRALVAMLALSLAGAVGCKGGDATAEPEGATPDAGDAGDAAALDASDASEEADAATTPSGDVTIDLRGAATITWTTTSDGALATSFAVTSIAGVEPVLALGTVAFAGRVERFPEAPIVLYTGHADLPAAPGGVCGASPVSLALSLVRRDGNARVAGSVVARCGAGDTTARPARILRLAGQVEAPR